MCRSPTAGRAVCPTRSRTRSCCLGADGEARAADRGHPRARSRVVGLDHVGEARVLCGRLVAVVTGREEEPDAFGGTGLEDELVDLGIVAVSCVSPHELLTMLARWLFTMNARAFARSAVLTARSSHEPDVRIRRLAVNRLDVQGLLAVPSRLRRTWTWPPGCSERPGTACTGQGRTPCRRSRWRTRWHPQAWSGTRKRRRSPRSGPCPSSRKRSRRKRSGSAPACTRSSSRAAIVPYACGSSVATFWP